jgi:hypothetical protein
MTSALAKQVAAANRRAKSMGVAGTLSKWDWEHTLEAFDGLCAYCGARGPLTIDHFIPLATWGGVTAQSNCVPSCLACNRLKADKYPDEQILTFVAPERLTKVRAYLQEIGRWHQESLKRARAHEEVLARGQIAVEALKCYCEQRAEAPDDPHATSYALFRRRIFGVAWDLVDVFQVQLSLHWLLTHATDQCSLEACKDAWRFFTAALDQDGASAPSL